jgi:hypothetical protein
MLTRMHAVCVFVLLILLDETAPRRIDHGRCYARSDAACRLAVDQPWMDGLEAATETM